MVSVIIPVYNAELNLNKCIDSVLNQTYRDFEVLLINDGSKDGSGAICDQYAAIDSRVRVVHQANRGVSATRNVGIHEARGAYISFVDSDDYIAPNMLEDMVSFAEHNNSDIVMCEYYTDKNGVITPVKLKYQETYATKQEVKDGLLYRYYTDDHAGLYSLWNKIIRREVVTRNEIVFDTTLKRGEDAWFVFQCLKHCSRVDFIAKPFYYYYQNESSIMHTVYDDQYEKWVEMRKRLLTENLQFNFLIDYNLFYRIFLIKVFVYCHALIKGNEHRKAKYILCDSFLVGASRYNKMLSKHFYVLSILVQKRLSWLAFLCCWLWAVLK